MADYLDNKLAEKNKKQEDLKEHPPVPDEDYEWDVDDGYGGDEYEVCNKGNDVSDGICEDWRKL